MADLVSLDLLWRYALAGIPLAILVAIFCRFVPCRPSTRHALWVSVLSFFLVLPFLPSEPLAVVRDARHTVPASIESVAALARQTGAAALRPGHH